mgnify:CR=1 FL=1
MLPDVSLGHIEEVITQIDLKTGQAVARFAGEWGKDPLGINVIPVSKAAEPPAQPSAVTYDMRDNTSPTTPTVVCTAASGIQATTFAALAESACDPFAHRDAPPLFAEAWTKCPASALTLNLLLQVEFGLFGLDRCYFP